MANRKLAKSITKKLHELDEKYSSLDDINQWFTQRLAQFYLANEKLKMISLPVSDGYVVYFETKRNTRQATFEFMYGGPDGYTHPIGDTFSIPIERADIFIKCFDPKHI